MTRTTAVDIFNRTLISDLLPSQVLRAAGLHTLNAIGPLRRLAMREGMQPAMHVPRLMQPLTLSGAASPSHTPRDV